MKYSISPFNIFGISAIGLGVYLLAFKASVMTDPGLVWAFPLMLIGISFIAVDYFFQRDTKNRRKLFLSQLAIVAAVLLFVYIFQDALIIM